ncbi:MAG: OmpH family outer membrane protein [Shimia sp.]
MRRLVGAILLALPLAGAAQEVPRSPILTITTEALLPGTAYGRRVQADLTADRQALAGENRRIEEELRAEELGLTERRGEIPREEFVRLARVFDERVEAVRTAQDAKEAALRASLVEREQAFLARVQPILGQIMIEAGAVVIVEADTVVLRNRDIDVTQTAIARIDAALGDGTAPNGAADGDTTD